jgi:hypothetical protein
MESEGMTRTNAKLKTGFEDLLRRAQQQQERLKEEDGGDGNDNAADESADASVVPIDLEAERDELRSGQQSAPRRMMQERESAALERRRPGSAASPRAEHVGSVVPNDAPSTAREELALPQSLSIAIDKDAGAEVESAANRGTPVQASPRSVSGTGTLSTMAPQVQTVKKQRRLLPSGAISYHGTIEEPQVRDRDGREVRRKNFILPVDLIERLEEWCARPKYPVNVFVEKAIEDALQSAMHARSGRRD